MAYDPQRNRVRAQPADDGPAPVDLVLGGAVEEPERAVLGGATDYRAAPDHEHSPDLRLMVAAGVATVVVAAFALRRRFAARR